MIFGIGVDVLEAARIKKVYDRFNGATLPEVVGLKNLLGQKWLDDGDDLFHVCGSLN